MEADNCFPIFQRGMLIIIINKGWNVIICFVIFKSLHSHCVSLIVPHIILSHKRSENLIKINIKFRGQEACKWAIWKKVWKIEIIAMTLIKRIYIKANNGNQYPERSANVWSISSAIALYLLRSIIISSANVSYC